MYTGYLLATIIVLVFILVFQLIRINIYILKIKKSDELNRVVIKEDTDWEFIKGLY